MYELQCRSLIADQQGVPVHLYISIQLILCTEETQKEE